MSFLCGLGRETKSEKKGDPVNVLVIQSDSGYNWNTIFGTVELENGRPVNVVQVCWTDIRGVSASCHLAQPVVHILRTAGGSDDKTPSGTLVKRGATSFRPHFVIIRNEVTLPGQDHSAKLYGLAYANVPSINSLSSVIRFMARPMIHSELLKINKRVGDAAFPLIPQNYFSSHDVMMYMFGYPAVVKVGSAHAGFGKMKVRDHHDMDDVKSVVAMIPAPLNYSTAEPFIVGQFDLRIQKIGTNFRVFKRSALAGQWKTNTGSSHLEEVEVLLRYRSWAMLASEIFDGLDICTVDVLVEEKTNKEYILEVNGTSSGLAPTRAAEDNIAIRELALVRLNELYGHQV
jgi:glutathione synthase/RimK-type ligase-like ATP-grasp enzyme